MLVQTHTHTQKKKPLKSENINMLYDYVVKQIMIKIIV